MERMHMYQAHAEILKAHQHSNDYNKLFTPTPEARREILEKLKDGPYTFINDFVEYNRPECFILLGRLLCLINQGLIVRYETHTASEFRLTKQGKAELERLTDKGDTLSIYEAAKVLNVSLKFLEDTLIEGGSLTLTKDGKIHKAEIEELRHGTQSRTERAIKESIAIEEAIQRNFVETPEEIQPASTGFTLAVENTTNEDKYIKIGDIDRLIKANSATPIGAITTDPATGEIIAHGLTEKKQEPK